MKRISIIVFLALGVLLLNPAIAQTPSAKEAEDMNVLISEVEAQQKEIAANQEKIDEKLATLADTIREARIFSSRTGR
jgi:peptidoglycan hydrolase CwlO-like protein